METTSNFLHQSFSTRKFDVDHDSNVLYCISFLVVHLSTAVNTVSGQAQMIEC